MQIRQALHGIRIVEDVGERGDHRQVRGVAGREPDHDAHRIVVRVAEVDRLACECWPAADASQRVHGRQRCIDPGRGEARSELDDTKPRAHVAGPYHVTPVARTARVNGPGFVAALAWAGTDRAESAPWKIVSLAAGHWKLSHPKLGPWEISHWSLPSLS